MFGMALVAIIMGVSLSSCNKDENPENDGDFSNEKKLVKEVWEEDGETTTHTYIYDDKGRLVKSTGTSMWNREYIWGDDAIMSSGETYTIENGLIQTYGGMTFTYNKSDKLIKIEESYSYTDGTSITTALWDGDKLVSVSYGNTNVTITYGESCKKGFNLPYYIILEEPLLTACPELFGMRTKQLPATITEKSDGFYDTTFGKTFGAYVATSTYTYEFDKDGYISKVTTHYNIEDKDKNTNTSYTDTVTYIWE